MKHKTILLLSLAAIMNACVFAQPRIKAQRTIGGNYPDDLRSMYLTKDGGIIVGGYSSSDSSGEKTENRRGSFGPDYWVVKLNNNGKIQWDKTIGGNAADALASLQQTDDGGYILGGSSVSNKSGEKTENNRGDTSEFTSDYWVVKLDSLHNIEWDRTIGGNLIDKLTCLQQTSDGGYILGGHSNSDSSGEKTENARDILRFVFLGDYWIVKLDSLGNIQWEKTIGGGNADNLFDLQQTKDGGYILGGSSDSDNSGEKTENSKGGRDYWLVKLDSLGNIRWDKTIGGNNADNLVSLQQTVDGGYILGGHSSSDSSGDKTENFRGDIGVQATDYWVVKLDSLLNIEWDKTIGGNDYEFFAKLRQTRDKGYLLGGYSESDSSAEKTQNNRDKSANTPDYWVVKLDSLHNIEWDKTIGGNSWDIMADIVERNENRYVVGGTSDSRVSGDKTQRSRGLNDYWIVELQYQKQCPKNINASKSELGQLMFNGSRVNDFTVYPNPTKNVFHVQTNGKAILSLTDQSGRVLLASAIENGGVINVSNIPAGIYYLKNTSTGAIQKVIVTK